jgi:TPR repeat protein
VLKKIDCPDSQSFKMQADEGSVDLQLNYGFVLFKGHGIPIDKSRAMPYFNLTADQGDVRAQFSSRVLLDDGDGLPIDKSLAPDYSNVAADQGDADTRLRYEMLTRSELF